MSNYWKRFSLLAFLSLVIAGYLLFHFTELAGGYQEEKSFCSISETLDCDTVTRSAYASFLGIPVAGWAIVYYLVLLVYILVATKDSETIPGRATKAADALLFYITLSLPPSFYLLAVMHFALKKYCMFCAGLDIANVLLFITAYRCPARTKGLVTSFSSGARTFFSQLLFIEKQESRGLNPGLAIWGAALLGFFAVTFAPNVLVQHYFAPRQASRTDREYLRPYLESWRDEKFLVLPFSTSESSSDRDYAIGAVDAPVTVLGFSDFECPFCKRTAAFLKPFIEKRQKDFRFIFKNYPIDQGCNPSIKTPKHQYACKAATLARCAGESGEAAFWKMHDALMEMTAFSEEAFSGLMKAQGLDPAAIDACMQGEAAKAKVQRDAEEGIALKVNSTPTLFINGRRLIVAPQYLPGVLEMILAEVKKRQAS